MYQVVKRDKTIVKFNVSKIIEAIIKSFDSISTNHDDEIINLLALRVCANFENKIKNNLISVEDIQDSVEHVLIQTGFANEAKAYILYRKQREKIRALNNTFKDYRSLIDSYLKKNENDNAANRLLIKGFEGFASSRLLANFFENEVFDEQINRALKSGQLILTKNFNLRPLSGELSFKKILRKGFLNLSDNQIRDFASVEDFLFSSLTIIQELSDELGDNLYLLDFVESIEEFNVETSVIRGFLEIYFKNLNESIFNSQLDTIYLRITNNSEISKLIISIFNNHYFKNVRLVFSNVLNFDYDFSPMIIAKELTTYFDSITVDLEKLLLADIENEITKITGLVERIFAIKSNLFKNLFKENLFPYAEYYLEKIDEQKIVVNLIGYKKMLLNDDLASLKSIVEVFKRSFFISYKVLDKEEYNELITYYEDDLFNMAKDISTITDKININLEGQNLEYKNFSKFIEILQGYGLNKITIIHK